MTRVFFGENTLRLLILCLPKLNLEARKDATQVVANLQRQQVHSRLVASDYLEKNLDLMDLLTAGYENTDLALHYGSMLRECICHQVVARYVLESEHMKKFFEYIQLPNFDIAADAAATFKNFSPGIRLCQQSFLTRTMTGSSQSITLSYWNLQTILPEGKLSSSLGIFYWIGRILLQ